MYKLSNFKKLNSNNKKELYISCSIENIECNNDDNYIIKELKNEVFYTNDKLYTHSLEFEVYFNFNTKTKEITNIHFKIVLKPSLDEVENEGCLKSPLIKANENISKHLSDVITNEGLDFEENIKKQKTSKVITKLIYEASKKVDKTKTDTCKSMIILQIQHEIKEVFRLALPFHSLYFKAIINEDYDFSRLEITTYSEDFKSFSIEVWLFYDITCDDTDFFEEYTFNSINITNIKSNDIYSNMYSLGNCEEKTFKYKDKQFLKEMNKGCAFKNQCTKFNKRLLLLENK